MNVFLKKAGYVFLSSLFLCSLAFQVQAANKTTEVVVASSGEKYLEKMLYGVMSLAFQKNGVKFTIKQFPKERSLYEANEGNIDGDGYRVYELQERTGGIYPNLVRVNEPYVNVYFSAFVTNPKIEINNWSDLKADYKVGIIRGNKTAELRLKEYVSEKNQNIIVSHEAAFKMLSEGRVDVVVTGSLDGAKEMKGYKNIYAKGKFEAMDIYLYLNKKHSDLIPKIEAEVRKMKKDGTIDKIEKKVIEEIVGK